MMIEQPQCAHLTVKERHSGPNEYTVTRTWWECEMCKTEFLPKPLADYEKADLQRQLAERDRIAYPIIGIPSAKDFARQCDPFEPDSETTTGTCAHWRDKVEKVFAQVRSIFDVYVQEKVDQREKEVRHEVVTKINKLLGIKSMVDLERWEQLQIEIERRVDRAVLDFTISALDYFSKKSTTGQQGERGIYSRTYQKFGEFVNSEYPKLSANRNKASKP